MPTPEELADQNVNLPRVTCGWVFSSRWPLHLCRGRDLAGQSVPLPACKSDDLLSVRGQTACAEAGRRNFSGTSRTNP